MYIYIYACTLEFQQRHGCVSEIRVGLGIRHKVDDGDLTTRTFAKANYS